MLARRRHRHQDAVEPRNGYGQSARHRSRSPDNLRRNPAYHEVARYEYRPTTCHASRRRHDVQGKARYLPGSALGLIDFHTYQFPHSSGRSTGHYSFRCSQDEGLCAYAGQFRKDHGSSGELSAPTRCVSLPLNAVLQFDAALYSKEDAIEGVSECIIMGNPAANCGTSM